MGKRGRPKKTTEIDDAKEKLKHVDQEIVKPADLVASALRNMGFNPSDLDLGDEMREVIEAMSQSPIQCSKGKGKEGTASILNRVEEEMKTPQAPLGEVQSSEVKSWHDLVENEQEGEKGKTSWAEIVKGDSALHPDQKLEYIPPGPEGVEITDEEIQEGEQLWKYAVVGFVLGQKPGFRSMQRYVRAAWKDAAPSVYLIADGVYLFNFSSEANMEAAIGKRWSFGKAPMILQKWNPGMRLESLKPDKVAVWIRISSLDLSFWSTKILSKLASFIGKPIRTDLSTAVRDRISFARVLVEVEVNKKLHDRVPITTSGGTTWTSVVYEWYPAQCSKCSNWGHKEVVCTGRNEPRQRRQEETDTQPQVLVQRPQPTVPPAQKAHPPQLREGNIWRAKPTQPVVITANEVVGKGRDQAICKALEAVLPPRTSAQLTDMELDECEETTLHDVNIEDEMRRKAHAQAQEAYDEDEDMHGGAQRVQCAQQ